MQDEITPLYRAIVRTWRPPLRMLMRQEWTGGEHIPRTGPVLVAANHLSYVDPLVLGHFLVDHGRAANYLAKAELLDVPVLGTIIRNTRQIPVYRNTARAADAFSAAVAAIEEGRCVGILPEGTLTRDPDLWPMSGKTGAARIALRTGCPLLPVALWGTQQVMWPYRDKVPRLVPRRTVHAAAGPPVDLSDLVGGADDRDALVLATDRIMDAITAQLELLRGATAPPRRSLAQWRDTGNEPTSRQEGEAS